MKTVKSKRRETFVSAMLHNASQNLVPYGTHWPPYVESAVGLLCSSMVGNGRAVTFTSQYNAM